MAKKRTKNKKSSLYFLLLYISFKICLLFKKKYFEVNSCLFLFKLYQQSNYEKESLSSNAYGHQFHQYQQNENNQLSSYMNTKKTTTHDVGDPGPGLGQAQQCGGVKSVNGVPTLPS